QAAPREPQSGSWNTRYRSRRFRGSFASALLLGAATTAAAQPDTEAMPGTPTTVRDFLIQNVCLDDQGAVLAGIAPTQDGPGCRAQRDLHSGERLPYHKHDHPSPEQR